MPKSIFLLSRIIVTVISVVLVCAYAPAATPNYPFSGRWRVDTASIKGNIKPTVFQLVDGGFKRDDNATVRADGRLHHVVSDGYVDEMSISVVSPHVVEEVDRVRGKLAYTVEYSISSDGNSLTWRVASYNSPNGQPVKSQTVQRRVGPAPKAAHLISGKWERINVTVDSKSDCILRLYGNRFSYRTEGGTGYDAIIGGKSVKIIGDNSGARALITRPRPDLIVETDVSARGQREAILSMQLMSDKKTIRGTAFAGGTKQRTTFYLQRVSK